MKWVFIFLLLLNVIYLGWEIEREIRKTNHRPVAVNSIPSSSRRLELITSKEAGDQVLKTPAAPAPDTGPDGKEQIVSTPDAGAGPPGEPEAQSEEDVAAILPEVDFTGLDPGKGNYYCFTFGPLAEEILAVGLSDWFRSRQAIATTRHDDRQGRQLFWIYLAPQDSRTRAMDTIKELRDQGINDYRLISHGNLENAISLGLFSSQASVNKRLRELEQKGYQPVVVPYYDNKRLYWVDVRLRETEVPLDSIFTGFPSRYDYVPVSCDKIAMDLTAP